MFVKAEVRLKNLIINVEYIATVLISANDLYLILISQIYAYLNKRGHCR